MFFLFFLFHELSLENMDRIFLEIKQNSFLSPPPPPPPFFFVSPPPPPTNLDSSGFDLNNKVSPSLLLIIVILAIIFFLSGLLHLLVRFLLRPPNRNPDDFDSVSALQGQLQQLFHLHDSGVDQSFIDTLPVFHYKAIIGLKDPFDCAVCLCEFECEDKLRLLPKCSHAFHMECIDTWLLSHSTCPLCRACLLSDFSQNNSRTPYVLVLESGSESSREIIPDRESSAFGVPNSVARTSSHLGCCTDDELGSSRIDLSRKSCEIHVKDDVGAAAVVGSGEKVVQVKLGKFKNVDGNGGGEGSTSNGDGGDNNAEARRCFSMGSFEYVMDENSSLQVPIRTPMKKRNQSSKKPSLPLTPGHRQAMSECDCDSRREFNGFDPFKGLADIHGGCSSSSISNSGNVIGRSKRESFSVSKIWMRATKKEKDHNSPSENSSSRRAFSFRFPVQKNASGGVAAAAADDDDLKMKNNGGRRSISEIGMVGNWEVNGNGNELGGGGFDVENQSCNSSNLTDSQAKTPSFARRTLNWLVGRQNKVVHSSFGPADV